MSTKTIVHAVLLLLACAALFLLALNLRAGRMPQADGDLLSLLPAHSVEQSAYLRTQSRFGDTLFESITLSTVGLQEGDVLDILYQLEQELTATPHVERVISPAFEQGRASLGIQLINREKSSMRFLVGVAAKLDLEQRKELQNALNELLRPFSQAEPARSGAFFISESVAQAIISENQRLVPITLAVLTIVCLIQFRSFRLSLYALTPPLLAVALIVLGVTALGKSFGTVSQLAPALLLAVGTVYGVQSQQRIALAGGEVKHEIRLSILLAASTTAVGLGSLWAIDIPAVRDFAIVSAIGVMLAGIIAILLLELSQPIESNKSPTRWHSIERLSLHPRIPMIIVMLGLLLLPGITQLRIHANPLSFLPENAHSKQSIETVQHRFPGNRFLSVHIESDNALSDDDFNIIDGYADRLRQQAQVLGVATGTDFKPLSKFSDAFSLVKREPEPFGPPFITSSDTKSSRILLEHGLEGADLIAFASELEQQAQTELGALGEVFVSGIELMLARQSEVIVRGILEALASTLLLVALLLYVLFRDIRIVVIGLVPNIIPIVAVFGLLGYWYGELQLAAALVAVSALSIAVDNTFHFLVALREFKYVDRALEQVLPAFIASTVLLICSFSVLALSSVQPVQQFGLLLACTLFVGLAADAVLLPWLLRARESAISAKT